MWWRKKKEDSDLVPHRNELNAMASALLKASEVDFDRGTPLEQALIGTFLFGMISTHGIIHKLTQPEVHGLALIVFKETLHYSDTAAVQGVQECINAATPGYHDTMNAILHRGIDGHRQYQNGDLDGLRKNIISVLDQFRKKNG